MKRLFFCRHGESYINIRDIFATKQGASNDLGLTDKGKADARTSAQQAKDEGLKFDAIVASPLLRTQETAVIVAKSLNFPVQDIQTSSLLIELQFGELEGTPWNAYWEAGHTYADLGEYKGAETLEAMQQRAQAALNYLRNMPEENILVVSHSAFGRALARAIQGLPYTDEFENHISLPHNKILQLI